MNKFEITKGAGYTVRCILDSGDGEEYAGCSMNLALAGYSARIPLPPIIKPTAIKVTPKCWDAETIKRLGRDYYYNYIRREYGFYLFDNHFNINYGRSTCDSSTEQRWSCFLPWKEYKYLGIKLFNIDGSLPLDVPTRKEDWKEIEKARSEISKAAFLLRDYDGEEVIAICHIEERRWDLGVGICSWLKYITPRRYRKVLAYEFSDDVGKRKNTWKGGIMASSIDLKDNESPESAIRRMCAEENMTFISEMYGLAPEVIELFEKRNCKGYRLLD